jgi:hypothetical protein
LPLLIKTHRFILDAAADAVADAEETVTSITQALLMVIRRSWCIGEYEVDLDSYSVTGKERITAQGQRDLMLVFQWL